jgi:hypothetical protein
MRKLIYNVTDKCGNTFTTTKYSEIQNKDYKVSVSFEEVDEKTDKARERERVHREKFAEALANQ